MDTYKKETSSAFYNLFTNSGTKIKKEESRSLNE